MKDWQKVISAVIIAVAIIAGAFILADAIRYAGEAINGGFTFLR